MSQQPPAVPRLKMVDIARMAGVSVSTVSRALAGSALIPVALRDRIEGLSREHGYVVNHAARNLRLQTTRTIGLVLPMGHEAAQKISDPFALEMIGHIADEIIQRGYDLHLTKIASPRDGWLNTLIQSHRFDGMLILGQSNQHAALDEAGTRYTPMVVWGERLEGQTYVSVGVDNVLWGQEAAEHLIEIGRKAIHFMGPLNVPEVDGRYRGYVAALTQAKLSPAVIESTFTFDAAYKAAKAFLKTKPKIDGLFCASDVIAHGAMIALMEEGYKVPEDCAICGFDDVSLARAVTPNLTTVQQNMSEAAGILADLLFRRLAGEAAESVVMPARLVVRASTVSK